MNCDEVEELIGAYALDALPDAEAAAMRTHLAGCETHRALAASLRSVADALPALADERDAPPELRSRVLDAVAREPQAARAAAGPLRITDARSLDGRSGGGRSFFRVPVYAWGAMAAALAIAVAGLLIWNINLHNRLDSRDDATHLASRVTWTAPLRSPDASATNGMVMYFGDEHKAVVMSDGMPQMDASKTYQLWAIGEGNPTSIGLMQVDAAGRATVVVPFDATATSTLAITVEPAGGSSQPTSRPVFIAKA